MGDKAGDPRASALSPIRTICNLCHCLAKVTVFLARCTYHNFPWLMVWHSDKSLLALPLYNIKSLVGL